MSTRDGGKVVSLAVAATVAVRAAAKRTPSAPRTDAHACMLAPAVHSFTATERQNQKDGEENRLAVLMP